MGEMASLATVVRACSVSDIMSNEAFPALSIEYEAESKIEGLPSPTAKMESYLEMEAVGMLHPFGAWQGTKLVGFISVLTPRLPRYGALMAVAESWFVASAHRKGGAGVRLLKEAERVAEREGSPGLFVSAPIKSLLVEALPKLGYKSSSIVFFKKFPQ